MDKELFASFRDAKIIKLLKIEVNEGEGVDEDPIRRVSYFCTLEGKVLWHNDGKKRKFAGEDEMNNIN